MIKLLKVDIKNCLNSSKFKIIFLFMLILILISFFMTVWDNYGLNNLLLMKSYQLEITRGFNTRPIYHFFQIFTSLLVTVIYSDSFFQEKRENLAPIMITKVGKKRYLLSKLLTIAIISFFSIVIVFILSEILTFIAFSDIGIYGKGLPVYDRRDELFESKVFLPIFKINYPWIYNIICICINGVFSSIIAVCSYSLSLLIKSNRLTILVTPYLINVVINIILANNSYLHKFSPLNLITGSSGTIYTLLITLTIHISIVIIMYIIGSRKEII